MAIVIIICYNCNSTSRLLLKELKFKKFMAIRRPTLTRVKVGLTRVKVKDINAKLQAFFNHTFLPSFSSCSINDKWIGFFLKTKSGFWWTSTFH